MRAIPSPDYPASKYIVDVKPDKYRCHKSAYQKPTLAINERQE